MNVFSPSACLPWWYTNTIEVVGPDIGDISSCRHTQSQKQQNRVSLMTHVLDTCDLISYTYSQGQLEWEKYMKVEMNYLLKNHTWDLVPRLQGRNILKCRWVYKTKCTN